MLMMQRQEDSSEMVSTSSQMAYRGLNQLQTQQRVKNVKPENHIHYYPNGRSPLVNKNLEHVFGAKNLPSDEIDKVVTNQFMKDAYAMD